MTDTKQTTNPVGLQIIWQPEWVGFGFNRMDGVWLRFYLWALRLGFIEIRRWS